ADMDMLSHVSTDELPKLIAAGALPASALDEPVRRILRAKLAAGLFEHPYTDEARAGRELLAPAHRALAREVAQRSIVLLKNEPLKGGAPVLPFAAGVRTLAVIGPFADDGEEALGFWSARGDKSKVVTLLAALRERKGLRLLHAPGTD